MTLYLKQRIFTISDKYSIFDENEDPVFNVEKQFFSIPSRFIISDINGNELFVLKKNFTLFLASYDIYKGYYLCASVQKELSFFKAKFSVKSQYGNFVIDGDIFDHNFSILKDGISIGSVNKKLFAFSDSYVLDIIDDKNAAFFCALVIAIDNCMHNQNN